MHEPGAMLRTLTPNPAPRARGERGEWARPLKQAVLTNLHRHVRAGIAPIGLAGRAAQRAHLRRVVLTARQSTEDDVLRVAREDARQPITISRLDAAFIHAGALDWIDPCD